MKKTTFALEEKENLTLKIQITTRKMKMQRRRLIKMEILRLLKLHMVMVKLIMNTMKIQNTIMKILRLP